MASLASDWRSPAGYADSTAQPMRLTTRSDIASLMSQSPLMREAKHVPIPVYAHWSSSPNDDLRVRAIFGQPRHAANQRAMRFRHSQWHYSEYAVNCSLAAWIVFAAVFAASRYFCEKRIASSICGMGGFGGLPLPKFPALAWL